MSHLNPETLARLQGLELRAQTIVEGFLTGRHRSPSHGFSVEFAEHREYSPGDDLRHLDWKVFGRTERFFLKQHEQETNLTCWLALDQSASMRYASGGLSKYEYAAQAAAAIAYLVLHQQDSVALATFADGACSILEPSGRQAQLQELIRRLDPGPANERTGIGAALHDLAERIPGRGLVFVISDFFDDLDQVRSGLKHLRHERHEIIVLQILDSAEIEFPFRRPVRFRGLEREPDLFTDPLQVGAGYRELVQQFLTALEARCRDEKIDYVLLRTDEPLARALAAFLAHRQRWRR